MNYVKYLFVLSVFFLACKNDSAATTQTEEPEATNEIDIPQKTIQAKVAQASPKVNMDTVKVSNLEELVENAKSNSVLILDKGTYTLGKDLVYYMTKDERKIIDKTKEDVQNIGGQLYFSDIENFQIIGENGAKIVSENAKAIPLFIRRGKNFKVSNFTIKKNIEGTGDLSYISNSSNVQIEKCKFDGGGIYGMYVNMSKKVTVNSCQITKCTNGAVRINESKEVVFNNSTFTKNICTVPVFNMYGRGSTATLNGVEITGNRKNTKSDYTGSEYIFTIASNIISLNNCVIRDNAGFQKLGLSPNNMSRTEIDGVDL